MFLRKKRMYKEVGGGICNNKAYYEITGLV